MNESKRKKVIKLFMEENDEAALKLLFKVTKDDIVNTLLNWRKEYEIALSDYNTPQFYMYEDIISYIFKKYKLNY